MSTPPLQCTGARGGDGFPSSSADGGTPMWTDSSYLLDAGGGFHPPPDPGPDQAPSPAMHQFPHLSIREAGTWCPGPLSTHSW